jgi:hypothetical protein
MLRNAFELLGPLEAPFVKNPRAAAAAAFTAGHDSGAVDWAMPLNTRRLRHLRTIVTAESASVLPTLAQNLR